MIGRQHDRIAIDCDACEIARSSLAPAQKRTFSLGERWHRAAEVTIARPRQPSRLVGQLRYHPISEGPHRAALPTGPWEYQVVAGIADVD